LFLLSKLQDAPAEHVEDGIGLFGVDAQRVTGFVEGMRRLQELGYPLPESRRALMCCDGDATAALEWMVENTIHR
jgi:hypothetical protein